jgi:hypothetical protein
MNIDAYETRLRPARDRFASLPGLRRLLSPDVDPELLEGFLIYFSALGVGTTELVESWILRAGERCASSGFGELGAALQRYAREERGHYLLMIDDLRALCAAWNARHSHELDPRRLLALPRPEAVDRYRGLHEEVISGQAPYAQLAIQTEIGLLSVTHGPALLESCKRRLGEGTMPKLTFLVEHVELDDEHTRFDHDQLAKLLGSHPETLPPLVEAGSAGLDAYGGFIETCVAMAARIPAVVG